MAGSRKVRHLATDEIIATIARSAFPSVVTEGSDDVIVWRRLESKFAEQGLTLIPAGGRDGVLRAYGRRGELPSKSVAMFIADQDVWCVSQVPPDYVSDDLFFTSGYSVENDMFIDGQLDHLLVEAERRQFGRDLEMMVEWYALACSRYLRGLAERLDVHPDEIIGDFERRRQLTALLPEETYPESLKNNILADAFRLLRGKTLFALLVRHASGNSYRSLLNFGASRNGALFRKVERSVGAYLSTRGAL
jgi:hypothetical protein